MRILILGGTRFVGRAFAEAALAAGHTLTLFNRGQTGPDLFPGIESIRGDRTTDLAALGRRSWDAVVDPSGYVPRIVGASAEALRESAGQYVFISSVSVYASARVGADEDAPVGMLADPAVETIDGGTYGPLKALCEQAVTTRFSGRTLIIRPGLIVGRYDPTDRFSYWPARVARGGEMLAPGRPGRAVQFIDVRDLAEWTLRGVETGTTGVFNATSPPGVMTFGGLLETARSVAGSNATITWADEAYLARENVQPWSELPVWVPESDPETAGFFEARVERAVAAGLIFRPLADTVRDTLAWLAARPPDWAWKAGLSGAREAALLAGLRV